MRIASWFAAAVLAAFSFVAHAHGPAEWIERGAYKNAVGELCCGERDCFAIAEGDVAVTDRSYLIKSLNETVPFNEALPLPNIEEAKGLYWRCQWGGQRKCFFSPNSAS